MGVLSVLGLQDTPRCELSPGDPARCTAPLTPRWRNNEVRGDRDRAMGFLCARCQRDFLPDEVRLRLARADAEAERAAQAKAQAAAAAPAAGATDTGADDAASAGDADSASDSGTPEPAAAEAAAE